MATKVAIPRNPRLSNLFNVLTPIPAEVVHQDRISAYSDFLDEQIPFADGFDASRMFGIIANFGSNAGYAHVDGSILAVILNATQGGEDFFAAQHGASVTGQQPEQIEFGTGQINALLIQPGFAHGRINNK